MGAKRERGAYGNARGVPNKQRRRRELRENDPRYQAAMAEVRAHEEMIDRLAAQSASEAAASAEERRRIPLTYVKPEVIVPEPTPKPVAPRIQEGGRRHVHCHCGDDYAAHTNPKAAPACVLCDCPGYRPSSAPDPLAESAVIVSKIGLLLQAGKDSEVKRTAALAEKIEVLLVDLRTRVDAETEAREEREAELRRTREARERVAQLEKELREARELLAGGRKKAKPRTIMAGPKAKPATTTNYERDDKGDYVCPECGETKGTPQGIGAHRARSHGYRKGDS